MVWAPNVSAVLHGRIYPPHPERVMCQPRRVLGVSQLVP